MLVGHSSYYLNSIWHQLDPFDPVFPSWGQFALRYAGYLCAPGFLMMAGAMVWWSYQRRIKKASDWSVRWYLIQRGLFLVVAQMTWVNSSWGGFRTFNPWHFGIIACIGLSMILLVFIIKLRWQFRLAIGLAILVIHPFLLNFQYDTENILEQVLMQTFIDSGDFNKYPVLPWFALAILGSVMATGWLSIWKTDKKRMLMSLGIAATAFLLAIVIRMGRGYGNISPFSEFGSWSFLLDQKYPPSLFMNLWFFASVVLGVSLFIAIGKLSPKLLMVFSIPGKVPLFFYAVHLAILGIFVKRLNIFYREGEVLESLLGVVIMLVVMLPLCKWFFGVKRRSKNYFIQMI
ncbi:MAG: heparan-alpha-glucosaminide N-acetyltransferase domain-containing protein [Bacteroidales bacterium]|nr:heparan-alpha-glucosaminide N-acetyltransferase domain-containing protein [Bacteroidales bacterium]